jgi:hypothetical protein
VRQTSRRVPPPHLTAGRSRSADPSCGKLLSQVSYLTDASAREEPGTDAFHRGDDQPAIKQIVTLLAACLGDEHAAVARRLMQRTITMGAVGCVAGADGIVGAQRRQFDGASDEWADPAAARRQASQRAVRAWRGRVQQHAI